MAIQHFSLDQSGAKMFLYSYTPNVSKYHFSKTWSKESRSGTTLSVTKCFQTLRLSLYVPCFSFGKRSWPSVPFMEQKAADSARVFLRLSSICQSTNGSHLPNQLWRWHTASPRLESDTDVPGKRPRAEWKTAVFNKLQYPGPDLEAAIFNPDWFSLWWTHFLNALNPSWNNSSHDQNCGGLYVWTYHVSSPLPHLKPFYQDFADNLDVLVLLKFTLSSCGPPFGSPWLRINPSSLKVSPI